MSLRKPKKFASNHLTNEPIVVYSSRLPENRHTEFE